MPRTILAAALLAAAVAPSLASVPANAQSGPVGRLLDELRSHFTLHKVPVPPEVFRDFGDGNLADSTPIWVTVDVIAAKGSNLYYDEVKTQGPWVSQTIPNAR